MEDTISKLKAVGNGLNQADLTLDANLVEIEQLTQAAVKQLETNGQIDSVTKESLTNLTEIAQGRLKFLHSDLPKKAEEYLGQIKQISDRASKLKEILETKLPENDDQRLSLVLDQLEGMSKTSEEILNSPLAKIAYFKTVVSKDVKKIFEDIESLANGSLEIKNMYETLEKIINLPETQRNRVLNVVESAQTEIDHLVDCCSTIKEVI